MELSRQSRPSSSSVPRVDLKTKVKSKILVVEDEPDIRKLIHFNLTRERFSVQEAEDGETALSVIDRERPDLVVLDLMLPGLTGLELCKLLRQRPDTTRLPIVVLTAKASEADRVVALEMGADDYVTKPFSPPELIARINAILRRTRQPEISAGEKVYEKGYLKIDFSNYEVFVKGKPAKLTLREFELLRFLVQNPNRVMSRDQILDGAWSGDAFVTPRTVDVHMRNLRRSVELRDHQPECLVTVRGVGYKFNEKALE